MSLVDKDEFEELLLDFVFDFLTALARCLFPVMSMNSSLSPKFSLLAISERM